MKKTQRNQLFCFIAAVLILLPALANAQGNLDDYERADSYRSKLGNLVYNSVDRPNWINESNRFWYRVHTRKGDMFFLVDAEKDAGATFSSNIFWVSLPLTGTKWRKKKKNKPFFSCLQLFLFVIFELTFYHFFDDAGIFRTAFQSAMIIRSRHSGGCSRHGLKSRSCRGSS